MKKLFFLVAIVLFCQNSYGQNYKNSSRPQWNGTYNGYGITPGYSYNPSSGWNRVRLPNGSLMSYRDGYVPPRRHYYNYNPWSNSYSSIINSFVYPGMGW